VNFDLSGVDSRSENFNLLDAFDFEFFKIDRQVLALNLDDCVNASRRLNHVAAPTGAAAVLGERASQYNVVSVQKPTLYKATLHTSRSYLRLMGAAVCHQGVCFIQIYDAPYRHSESCNTETIK
jgi:hypothetical protein